MLSMAKKLVLMERYVASNGSFKPATECPTKKIVPC